MSISIQPFQASSGPVAYPETAAFWEAARCGTLLLPRCTGCARVHWYPRAFCPFCHHGVEWVEGSGRAVVYALTRTSIGGVPYSLAYVTLEEGPHMLTNLMSDDGTLPAVGAPVQVEFVACANGEMRPVFRSAGAMEARS